VVSRTLSPLVLYCVHQTTAFLHIDSSALCQVQIIFHSVLGLCPPLDWDITAINNIEAVSFNLERYSWYL
jgi:hypothetical protein